MVFLEEITCRTVSVFLLTFSVSRACRREVNSVVRVNTRVPSGLLPSASKLSSSRSSHERTCKNKNKNMDKNKNKDKNKDKDKNKKEQD